ncbi:EVG1 protein, partial [Acromyrmex heyeri]
MVDYEAKRDECVIVALASRNCRKDRRVVTVRDSCAISVISRALSRIRNFETEMERKYQRVGLGVGAFHNPPRAKYSEETKNLIKLLMEESKLSMMQRKMIQEAVDKGESLPPSIDRTKKAKDKVENDQVKFPNAWRRRSQDMIISSGAYEREQYRRTAPLLEYKNKPTLNDMNFTQLANKEKQKRHLACMMAFGKDMPETPHGPKILHRAKREPEIPENADFLNDLTQGIRERMDFLHDMESLGMGKKYRPIIQQEIAQKIRLMESLDNQTSDQLRKEFYEVKDERPSSKLFPLTEPGQN